MKYSESSLICRVYTESLGLKSYLVKGARRPKSRQKANLLQPMSLLALEVYDSKKKSLHTIKEMRPMLLYQALPFDTLKGSVGLFLMEVLGKSVLEGERNPELFDFIRRALIFLDETDLPIANFHLFFLLKISRYLGIEPMNNWSETNPFFGMAEGHFDVEEKEIPYSVSRNTSKRIAQLCDAKSYDEVVLLNIRQAERENTLRAMLRYFEYHLESFKNIQSVRVLKEVMS